MKGLFWLASAVMFAITLTACFLYYQAVEGWSGAIRANRVLSAEVVRLQETDERDITEQLQGLPVEVGVTNDGTVIVRLNRNDNLTATFPGACSIGWRGL